MARRLVVEIIGDNKSLQRAFRGSSRDAESWGKSINRAARGGVVATVGFRGLGRSVAFASGAFLGGAGFVAGARASLKAASDLSEEINKSRVLFGDSAREVQAWSSTTAKGLGLSQRAALQAAGNFGAMFETLGLGDRVASRMSRRLVGLGSDLASFANEDPTEMLDRLRSGLAGEAEPLRRFGILLSEARVQQEAYRLGIAKVGEKLTEQQKVQARFNLILKDSAAAQGDFARTSRSQANQERINTALREEAARRIGQVLLPAYNKATQAVNKWLGDEKNLAKVQRGTEQALGVATRAAKAFADAARAVAPTVERVNTALGGTTNAVKLLLAVFVATKVLRFAGALTGLNAQLLTTTARANALRFALLRLGAIGVIALGIELIINRKQVDDKINELLRGHGLGGLTAPQIEIPLDFKAADLVDIRRRVAGLRGETDFVTKAVDAALLKFRQLDQQRFLKARAGLDQLQKRLNAIKGKEVRVAVVESGLQAVKKQLAQVRDKDVHVQVLERGVRELLLKLSKLKGPDVPVQVFERGIAEIEEKLRRLREHKNVVQVGIEVNFGRTGTSNFAALVNDVVARARKELEAATKKAQALRASAVKQFTGSSDRRQLDLDKAAAVGAQAELREIAKQQAAVQEQIRIQGRTVDLDRQLFELEQQRKSVLAQLAAARQESAQRARDNVARAKQAQRDAFEEKLAWLGVAQARAEVTKTLSDDLKVANRQLAAIRAQIRVEGKTAELTQQLIDAKQRRRDLRRQEREQARGQRTARQFKTLGLTAEGETRVPGVKSLRKSLGSITEAVKGTFLDTDKTKKLLAAIRKVLSAGINNVSAEVRAKIAEMLGDLNQQLKDNSQKKPLTKGSVVNTDALLEGLGLTPEQVRALKQRLSKTTRGGTGGGGGGRSRAGAAPVQFAAPGGVTITGPITVVSNDPADMLRKLQRKARRRATQTTGPHAGNATGTTR